MLVYFVGSLSGSRVVCTAEDEHRLMSVRVVVLLAGEQGVRARCETPPGPTPTSPSPRRLSAQAGSVAKPSRCVRGLLVLLPYPSDAPLFKMPPPSSPTVLSPSHHPVPFPSELTAICALRNTPRLFIFSLDLSSTLLLLCALTCRMLPWGVLKLFHVRDPHISPH